MVLNKSDPECIKAIYTMRETAKRFPTIKFVYTDNPLTKKWK